MHGLNREITAFLFLAESLDEANHLNDIISKNLTFALLSISGAKLEIDLCAIMSSSFDSISQYVVESTEISRRLATQDAFGRWLNDTDSNLVRKLINLGLHYASERSGALCAEEHELLLSSIRRYPDLSPSKATEIPFSLLDCIPDQVFGKACTFLDYEDLHHDRICFTVNTSIRVKILAGILA